MTEKDIPAIVEFWTRRSEGKAPEPTVIVQVDDRPEITLQQEAPTGPGNLDPDQRIVRARPDLDEVAAILGDQARRAAVYAGTLTIETLEDQKRVVRDLGAIAGLKKRLEAKRLEFTDPLTKLGRQINDWFKDITIPLKEADDILREKDKAFDNALQALRAAAENVERLRLIAEQEQAKLTGEIIETKPTILSEPASSSTMRVETGTRHWRDVPKWAILDEALVPREWLTLDTVKINKAVNGGEENIPGLTIWSEREARVRARDGE